MVNPIDPNPGRQEEPQQAAREANERQNYIDEFRRLERERVETENRRLEEAAEPPLNDVSNLEDRLRRLGGSVHHGGSTKRRKTNRRRRSTKRRKTKRHRRK